MINMVLNIIYYGIYHISWNFWLSFHIKYHGKIWSVELVSCRSPAQCKAIREKQHWSSHVENSRGTQGKNHIYNEMVIYGYVSMGYNFYINISTYTSMMMIWWDMLYPPVSICIHHYWENTFFIPCCWCQRTYTNQGECIIQGSPYSRL